MNKSYIFLIGILVVLAAAIGGFAFYRSTMNKPIVPAVTIPVNNPAPVVKTAPPPPLTEEQLVSKNNTLPLTVTAPQNGAQLSSSSLTLTGTTAANADVSVNDKDLKADANGKFSSVITLEEGDNYILVVSSNENGASEWQGTVTYTPASAQ